MRIAYVITRSDEIGGAHIHVRDMAVWMQRNGHRVRVFCGGEGAYTEMLRDAGVTQCQLRYLQRSIAPIRDWRAIGELVVALSEYGPDLVSLHSAKAGLLGRIACRKLDAAVVFTAHGWSFAEGVAQPARWVYRQLERWTAPLASKIITVCETDRTLALEQGVGDESQLIAINNGMPVVGDELVSSPVNDEARIIMVARFERQKDHTTLVTALAGLHDLNWRLDLVGDGPLVEEIRGQVAAQDIGARVNFLGRRNDVARLLSQSDIFVLASFWEGFPRSILEAMRAALPVIASRVAGVPEAVEESETGYLVEPGDSERLRDCLRQLILNKSLRRKMGARGRQKFERQFTFEVMARKTFDIYRSTIAS